MEGPLEVGGLSFGKHRIERRWLKSSGAGVLADNAVYCCCVPAGHLCQATLSDKLGLVAPYCCTTNATQSSLIDLRPCCTPTYHDCYSFPCILTPLVPYVPVPRHSFSPCLWTCGWRWRGACALRPPRSVLHSVWCRRCTAARSGGTERTAGRAMRLTPW